jgi:hypothetical protein
VLDRLDIATVNVQSGHFRPVTWQVASGDVRFDLTAFATLVLHFVLVAIVS